MIKSESIKELLTALAKAQGKISAAKKDSTNPHFKSKYADLASCWEAIKEPLSANGLSLSQWVSSSDKGLNLITMLGHSSGEYIYSEYSMPSGQTSQAIGSAITYARRYALSAAVGLVADDDDDGNASTQQASQKPAYVPPVVSKSPKMTTAQYKELLALAVSLGFNEETLISSDKQKRQPDDWTIETYADIKTRLTNIKKPKDEVNG
jgi:hypothetical protein